MRIYVRITVYVVAFASGQIITHAANEHERVTNITPVTTTTSSATSSQSWPAWQNGADSFNGFQVYRATPDPGAPGSPGFGFQHFPLPMHHYNNWYRPRAATLTKSQRCARDLFRPRGYGHLMNPPCDGFRMEYSPYVLRDDRSLYGPSYIARQPDPRCNHHCEHSGHCDHGDRCDECED